MTCTEQMPLTAPNLMSIWYHDKNVSDDMQRQMKIYLHQKFNYSRIFNTIEDFTGYLSSEIVVKHIIFIISSKDSKHVTCLQRLAQRRRQCLLIHQLSLVNQKPSSHLDPASVRSTIKNFDTIIDDLRKVKLSSERPEDRSIDEETVMDESTLPFGIFKSISAQNSFCFLNKESLNKESLKFLLFQSLIDVVVKMSYDRNAFDHMCGLCRMDYQNNCVEMKKIDNFAANYEPTNAIYYYTQSSFLFRLLNRAFRLDDVDRIYRFGCYMADLYDQLKLLGNDQRSDPSQTTKPLYRGKKLSTDVLQQLKDNIGQLIAMNGLLSTTKDLDTSKMFAGVEGSRNDYQSVIFEMHINNTPANSIRPFANISQLSMNRDENEVLFFMGFVWKIKSMEEREEMTTKFWHIVLESCTDYDSKLVTYIESSERECSFLALGVILQELGDYANAKNFYQLVTDDENLSDETRGHAYYNIAKLAHDRGEYNDELMSLREAEKLIKQIATPNDEVLHPPRPLFAHNIVPSRIRILNNIAQVYLKKGNYKNARDHFEKALKEPGSEVEKAVVLNNYGLLEYQCGNYNQARDYFHKAVQLAQNDASVTEFKDNLNLTNNMLFKMDTESVDTTQSTN